MIRTATALAAVLALAAPAAALADDPGAVPPSQVIASDATYQLQSNTTQEFTLPFQGLGVDRNVLVPCWGFSVTGPGVDIAGADVPPVGTVKPEDQGEADALGAVQQADGSWVIPDSRGALTPEVLRMGANCRSVDWDFWGPNGATLDVNGNPWPAQPATAARAKTAQRKASKAKKARDLKRLGRKVHSADAGSVTVTMAALRSDLGLGDRMVVRVTTTQLNGPTSLDLHARVQRQQ